ncbi:DUF7115 domain-containing protein [Natranaeroarchaeum aerophilus]|uniref:DUF7115 domain-containing protein n=1 Tax=Natranaeroarchaeum aerophilus TaxID=2917711 RepID=A0AAE3FTD1_9EURY|nr:hypothetical protein [Natranaeroarchaeum aerophilus]MCL9814249.1 hypothetical protein [Natranaeroarchaeum aerophilus]
MSEPGVVESALDGETVAASVPLGGEDKLYITPTRTLIYRAEGLLSDESVEEYPHDAERLTISEGRRKTRFSLDYPVDGTREFTIPSKCADDVTHPVVAGIMNAAGITEPGETVLSTYRFSELTLIVTSERLVKHIGAAVWDTDYEEFHYDDVTDLTFEKGSVATQVVLEVNGRQQRIKAPNDQARDVESKLSEALTAYHGVNSIEELRTANASEEEEPAEQPGAGGVAFGEGVDPLEANPPSTEGDEELSAEQVIDDSGGTEAVETAEPADPSDGPAETEAPDTDATESDSVGANDRSQSADDPGPTTEDEASTETADDDGFDFEDVGFEPAESDPDGDDIAEELAELRAVVEHQNERLDKQREAIERLIEELSRGR